MKIIILEGNSNKGKTTTLGMVLIGLLNKNYKLLSLTPITISSNMDFEAVLKYKNKKIAVYTRGDNIIECNSIMSKYALKKIDLIMAYSKKKTRLTFPIGIKPKKILKTMASSRISEVQANKRDTMKILKKI